MPVCANAGLSGCCNCLAHITRCTSTQHAKQPGHSPADRHTCHVMSCANTWCPALGPLTAATGQAQARGDRHCPHACPHTATGEALPASTSPSLLSGPHGTFICTLPPNTLQCGGPASPGQEAVTKNGHDLRLDRLGHGLQPKSLCVSGQCVPPTGS